MKETLTSKSVHQLRPAAETTSPVAMRLPAVPVLLQMRSSFIASRQSNQAVVIQLQLRGEESVLSGKSGKLKEEEGRKIMDRLTSGDDSVFEELTELPKKDELKEHAKNSKPPPENVNFLSQGREYGLILEHDTNEAHIIVGNSGGVDWGPFLKLGKGIAHTHPLVQPLKKNRYVKENTWNSRTSNNVSFADIVKDPAGHGTYLPTTGDVGFTILSELARHTVYTPYQVGKKEENFFLVDAIKPNDLPKLTWDIIKPSEEKEEKLYTGTLRALAGDEIFWEKKFTMPSKALGMTTPFTFL